MTENGKPRLNPDLLVEIRGKDVPSYAGVLDLAHQHGLKGIRTTMLQGPTEANGREAIVHATVTMLDPERGERTFEAIGDANPDNVNRPIAAHIIRMAETRAKGRAMRDATNIGLAIAEELGEDHAEPPMAAARPAQASRAAAPPPGETLTATQRGKLRYEAGRVGVEPHEAASLVVGRAVESLDDLTKAEASKVIDWLVKREPAPKGQTERAGPQAPRGRP